MKKIDADNKNLFSPSGVIGRKQFFINGLILQLCSLLTLIPVFGVAITLLVMVLAFFNVKKRIFDIFQDTKKAKIFTAVFILVATAFRISSLSLKYTTGSDQDPFVITMLITGLLTLITALYLLFMPGKLYSENNNLKIEQSKQEVEQVTQEQYKLNGWEIKVLIGFVIMVFILWAVAFGLIGNEASQTSTEPVETTSQLERSEEVTEPESIQNDETNANSTNESYVAVDQLNVRILAGASHPLSDTIMQGVKVKILDTENDWSFIEYEKPNQDNQRGQGWVMSKHLRTPTPTANKNKTLNLANSGDYLNSCASNYDMKNYQKAIQDCTTAIDRGLAPNVLSYAYSYRGLAKLALGTEGYAKSEKEATRLADKNLLLTKDNVSTETDVNENGVDNLANSLKNVKKYHGYLQEALNDFNTAISLGHKEAALIEIRDDLRKSLYGN